MGVCSTLSHFGRCVLIVLILLGLTCSNFDDQGKMDCFVDLGLLKSKFEGKLWRGEGGGQVPPGSPTQ